MKRTMSRLFTAVAMAALLVSASIVGVSAAHADTCTGAVTFGGSLAGGTDTATVYQLPAEGYTATGTLAVSGKVVLCLNDATLTAYATAEAGSFITVPSGAELTICGGTEGTGVISGTGTTVTRGILVQSGGKLTMESGTISGFTAAETGAGVCADGGTFTMDGGLITANDYGTSNGGIVGVINGGTFTMNGGTVTQQGKNAVQARYAGSNMTFNGGTVSGNIQNNGSGTATLNNDFYTNGTLQSWSNGKTIINDDVTVREIQQRSSGNITVNGGHVLTNVTMNGANGSINITGGKIDGTLTETTGTLTITGGQFKIADPTNYVDTAAYSVTDRGEGAEYRYVVAEVPNHSHADDADGTVWEPISAATTITAGGHYYLDGDVTNGRIYVDVSDGSAVTLCMNGHNIKHSIATQGICVNAGELTICNCEETTGGAITVGGAYAALQLYGGSVIMENGVHIDGYTGSNHTVVQVGQNCSFTMNGGSINDNTAHTIGASTKWYPYMAGIVGAYTNSVVTLNGGTIQGNTLSVSDSTAARNAAPVILYGGTVKIGGSMQISDNTVKNTATSGTNMGYSAGGVLVLAGKLEMDGGTISVNSATGANHGGGVCMAHSSSTFTMTGGTISGNTAVNGGGVTLAVAGAKLAMSGTAAISNNNTTGNGGGVYVPVGTFTMTGGTLSGNTATGYGTGVYCAAGTCAFSGSAEVNGEIVPNNGNAKITINGGTFSNSSTRALWILGGGGNVTITGGTFLKQVRPNAGTLTIQGGAFADVFSGGGTITISGGKFSKQPNADWLATNAGMLSVMDNTGTDAAAYPYMVGKGYVRMSEFMNFGSSLALTIGLTADMNFEYPEDAVLTVNNKTFTPEVSDTSLSFTISDITAKQMHDGFAVKVVSGSDELYSETLSVYALAAEWHADASHANAKTMLADMIAYGNAARKEFEYNYTEGETVLPTLDGGSSDVTGEWEYTGASASSNADKFAVSLNLKDQIELNIYVNDNATVTSDSAHTVTKNDDQTVTRITFDQIAVTEVKEAVTLVVTLSDKTEVTVTCSIADYILAAKSGEQGPLLEALQKYVDSVSNYLNLSAQQ